MYKILYVEDNFENYKLVEFVLKKEGFDVQNAVDGLDAIDKVKTYEPDLIIMDINLPNMMGYEVTSWLKSTEYYKNIPVVALTAAYSDDYEDLSKMSGCVAYYTKPVNPISFGKEIRQIIESEAGPSESNILSKEISRSLEDKARKIQQLNKKIVGYENKISNILSNLSDIIIITDSEYKILYYNSQAVQSESFRNKYKDNAFFFDIFNLTSMEIEDIETLLEEKGELVNIEIELTDEKGNKSFYLGNFNKMDEDEILVSLREVSQKVKFEEKMDQIDKMAGLGLITSGIIHEINNPLTAIKTYIEILKMKIQDESLKSVVDKLESGFYNIEKLTNSLLNFAKPSQEKMYPVNINNIVKEVMNFSEYEIRRGNVNIELNLQEDLPNILGIKSQLEQVVLNILLNANHAVQGKENPLIIINTYTDNNFVVLSVSDNGCGILESEREKIFEPFYTTKTKEKATGLGLCMSKEIVQKHNGIIDFSSDKSATTFYIKFNKYSN